jgi:hypothetical protein
MTCHPKKIFEKEFKTFLQKISKNPAFLKNNPGELRRILSKLKTFDKTELDSTLYVIRKYVPRRSRIYVNANDAIQDIERAFIKLANVSKPKETSTEIYTSEIKKSSKPRKTAVKFLKQ